ncbi:MAG: ATP-grasp domain-containing protein, partial [Phycisphaerales bacterium]
GVRGGVRGADGACRFFPITENVHRDGILLTSIAPAPGVSAEVEALARAHATRLMEGLGHVGVLAVELFETGEGLIANEFAPRVHNTGHWTMDGAACGQFAQHVRAVLGLPLGETRALGHAGMVNLVGCLPDIGRVLGVAGTRVHLYEKEARPGRKLGHVNILAETAEERDARVAEVLGMLPEGALGGGG